MNFLRKIQQDKLLHFIANAIITFFIFVIFSFFTSSIISLASAFVISLLVATAKELVWDKALKKGVCNFKDFIWGFFGTLFESISIIILLFL